MTKESSILEILIGMRVRNVTVQRRFNGDRIYADHREHTGTPLPAVGLNHAQLRKYSSRQSHRRGRRGKYKVSTSAVLYLLRGWIVARTAGGKVSYLSLRF